MDGSDADGRIDTQFASEQPAAPAAGERGPPLTDAVDDEHGRAQDGRGYDDRDVAGHGQDDHDCPIGQSDLLSKLAASRWCTP
jgi:hypothetical protein